MLSSGAIQGPAAPDNLKSHNFKRSFLQLRAPINRAVFLFMAVRGMIVPWWWFQSTQPHTKRRPTADQAQTKPRHFLRFVCV